MAFDTLLIPTGSIQYSYPITYAFESLVNYTSATGSAPVTVGQLWPDGRSMGLGQT